jgi:hypothetical protein
MYVLILNNLIIHIQQSDLFDWFYIFQKDNKFYIFKNIVLVLYIVKELEKHNNKTSISIIFLTTKDKFKWQTNRTENYYYMIIQLVSRPKFSVAI